MDTFCHQAPCTTNTQGENTNVINKRRISSEIMAETIKGFNGLTIQSTINDSAYYNSEEADALSGPNRDPKVDTYNSDGKKIKVTDTGTNNKNYSGKLLINRLISKIIPVAIPPVYQTITDDAAEIGETLHARRTIP